MSLMALVLTWTAAAGVATDGPHKLIVVANDSTVAIDYPTRSRCLRAAFSAEDEARRRLREASAGNGDQIIKPALRVIAFCIPG